MASSRDEEEPKIGIVIDSVRILGHPALIWHDIQTSEQGQPGSNSRSITWLFRSVPRSLSRSRATRHVTDGMNSEPGSLDLRTTLSNPSRTRKGRSKKTGNLRVKSPFCPRCLKLPCVRHVGYNGANLIWPLFVASPRQSTKPFFSEYLPNCGRSKSMASVSTDCSLMSVTDRFLLWHRDNQLACRVLLDLRLRPIAGLSEETAVQVVAELVARRPERAVAVSEPLRCFRRGNPLVVESSQCFICLCNAEEGSAKNTWSFVMSSGRMAVSDHDRCLNYIRQESSATTRFLDLPDKSAPRLALLKTSQN